MATSVSAQPVSEKRRGGRLGYILIGVLAAVLACGWAFVMGHVGQTPGIASQTITYEVLSDSSVQLKYSVAKPKDDEVRCTVDAYDTALAVLTEHEITVPRGSSNLTRTENLTTAKRATGARVRDCHKV
ncbi:DUF4307 domain-containing protein [Actinomadura xylanilytica]|uniref:DUF4307 domain-containing protein n=1 Tax=Actinomadura xylanilytica TaxID=887459 RepID=UPI00255A9B87|nr:DUF4307 domain-containing protein [Actinomadura xylanilytica]MDL4772278.1 DUF4307 domain-containing protein [Actinomadura xylanilytica]